MKSTEILSSEHRVIEQVLRCLERIVQEAETLDTLDRDSAEKAVAFFRNFADQCHHGKEEAHLFPAMEAKGYSREQGPTGVMMAEHELGRMHVRAMADSIAPAAEGDAKALQAFVEHAREYGNLLWQHIEKEDHCLFAMAEQVFTEDDQQKLLTAFQKVETEEMGAGVHEQYLAMADQLADRYGVPRATSGHAGCGLSRCCH
jgi:hemerythrin-like domain-containing protein